MKRRKSPNPHRAVADAVKTGGLPRLDGTIGCVDCGKPARSYDHRDYAKPLEVEPVCTKCNHQRGPAKNRHLGSHVSVGSRRITLELPKQLLDRYKKIAKRERRSRQAQIAVALTEWLAEQESQSGAEA